MESGRVISTEFQSPTTKGACRWVVTMVAQQCGRGRCHWTVHSELMVEMANSAWLLDHTHKQNRTSEKETRLGRSTVTRDRKMNEKVFQRKQGGVGVPSQFPNQLMTILGTVGREQYGETWETKPYLITGHLSNTTGMIASWVDAGVVD